MAYRIQVHRLIGIRLRVLRQGAGRLQEDVAAAAREYGFDWTRGTVAAIEAGQRRVTIEEFLALPTIISHAVRGHYRAGASLTVGLRDLVDGDHMVMLTPDAGIPTSDLEPALPDSTGTANVIQLVASAVGKAGVRATRIIPATGVLSLSGSPKRMLIRIQSRGEAEAKAARALGVSPVVVTTAAWRLWNQSLSAQRDAVVARQEPMPPRRRQALRGHVTRQLLEELRPLLKDIKRRRR